MTLIDTSLWADHFGQADLRLRTLLDDKAVVMHPYVVGELLLGDMPNRNRIRRLLNGVPESKVATHDAMMLMVERHHLAGSGVGYVDAHLLASALLTPAKLWSRDKRLRAAAERLGVAHAPVAH